MKSLFSKKPPKTHNPVDDEDPVDDFSQSQPPSPTKSPTKASARSPSKKSHQASPSSREPKPQPRTSRSFARQATDPGHPSSSRKKKHDPDTHPLNLPPEERKRLSALSAMSDRNSMDIDREPPKPGSPTSPTQQQQQQQQQPAAPSHSNSFTVPVQVANGTNGVSPGGADTDAPPPPPHTSAPSSPEQTAAVDAENFKNDGNKFFKAKDYTRAIECYTKG